jgi:outer membrane murein-binding lipoprotein Lpp
MGVRTGVRHTLFVGSMLLATAIIIFSSSLLSGCATCKINKEISTELKELTTTAPRYAQQSYSYQEKQIKKECYTPEEKKRQIGEEQDIGAEKDIESGKFLLHLGPVEWVDKPPIEGQTNWIRRQMTIYNDYDDLKVVWLDKIDYYDGVEKKRSKNPMKILVEGKSSRQVPLMKNVQYDPKINIGADFANKTKTEQKKEGMEEFLKNIKAAKSAKATKKNNEICEEKEVLVDKTGYKNISVGTKEVIRGYKEILKVKLRKSC